MTAELVTTGSSQTVSLIQQTALEMNAASQIANVLCKTSFVPTHFRGKPEECTIAILYGATIGFDPMTAVQQLFVIGGKPALYARAMVAIVLSKGHEIWTEEEAAGTVTVAGRRKGSDKIERVTWTSALAQTAGYASNAKYRTDPRSMLYARASGDVSRRIAPDALLGMAYNVEELELGEVTATVVPDEPSQRSGVGRLRAAIGSAPAPALVDVSDAVEVADDVVPPEQGPAEAGLTQAQSRDLYRLLKLHGLDDKDAALAYLGNLVGHDLVSTKNLSKTEASKSIDALKALPVAPPEPVAVEPEPSQDSLDADAAWLSGNPAQA